MDTILEIDKIISLGNEISPVPKLKVNDDSSSMKNPTIIEEDRVSEFMSKSFFNKAGFISNETWDTNLYIQSKVASFNDDFVECLCLMDKENHHFEYRSFPRLLFDNIENLKSKPYLILNIKSKASSIRIDISEGEKRVEKKLFELEQEWENLDDSGLGTPYTGIDI